MKSSGKPFSKKGSEKSSDNLPIVQLVIMAIAIVIMAAVFVQNRQPAVQIVFLGQRTLPISLSVAMLIAFGVGGAIAFTINAIASWRHNTLIKQALAAGLQTPNTEIKSNPPASEQKEVKTSSQNFYQTSQNNQSSQNNQNNNDLREDDDWEEDELEEDDLYEEDLEEEELEEEDYEDEDPETVPYGDLQKRKSSKSNRQKRDRPPLDARYIR